MPLILETRMLQRFQIRCNVNIAMGRECDCDIDRIMSALEACCTGCSLEYTINFLAILKILCSVDSTHLEFFVSAFCRSVVG